MRANSDITCFYCKKKISFWSDVYAVDDKDKGAPVKIYHPSCKPSEELDIFPSYEPIIKSDKDEK